MITGLERLYENMPWSPHGICSDPWGGHQGHTFHGAFEGVAEFAALEEIHRVVYEEAKRVASDGRAFAMAECGTCDGGSTIVCGHAIKVAGATGKIWTAEICLVRSDGQPRPWPKVWQDFEVADYIVACIGDTRQAKTWNDAGLPNPVDAAFIDSEHNYKQIMDEWAILGPRMKHGGKVLFHDCMLNEYPGVIQAVGEIADILDVEPEFLRSSRGLALLTVP